ncbi:MAG: hypothetical protein JWO80_2438, partial [Bryobacterales bacterium]|nr:hypothetical protein [Bryobacterales bacterium]
MPHCLPVEGGAGAGVAVRIRRPPSPVVDCGQVVHEHELDGALGLEFAVE